MTNAELVNHCVQTARHFRLGHDAHGHDMLMDVLDGLEAALTGGMLDPVSSEPVLAEMLAARQRTDLLLLADILEHIIAPSIPGDGPASPTGH